MITSELFIIEMRKFLDDIDSNMPSEILMSYYKRLNEELDDSSFLRAISNLRNNWESYGKPYPTKLEFIRASKINNDELEDIALRAYNLARETAIYQGCYISPDFEDEIIADVIDSYFGSWFNFHNKVAYRDSDDTFVKKDFIRAYKRKAETKKIKKVKLIGYGPNPRDLSIKADYELPIKRDELIQLENKIPVNSLVANLTKQKRM